MLRTAGALTAATLLLTSAPSSAAGRPPEEVIRVEDQRVAETAYRLAVGGVARCPAKTHVLGLTLQHLGQFGLADRQAAATLYNLDRGPGILVVVPGGPAARAGVRAGDVLVAIEGVMVPAEPLLDQAHDQSRARERADRISDLLDTAAADGTVALTLWRPAGEVTLPVAAVHACPSRVHLARSKQLNAFADGTHVLLTTRLLTLTRDDDELAFVIAHEMAHNILGHAAKMRAVKQEKRGLAALLARPALTRRIEREADLLAADLLLDSGYTVDGAAGVLHALDSGFGGPAVLADHDSIEDRAAALQAHAAGRVPSAR
ncbi:M48 family metallopeptidase [Sphingomonas sp.]|jgi:hypothetical protein|uniref:M48 family metallopeptidase n=1 Tax=Sphingomonas sp. TaxID=28214 RepID=UPI002D7FC647|nr:M48 family metallopeptidase [Sphingomonas sp.]HEU0044517.1 M48 family metallopeptidase [Sphingomonas sp.]